MNKKVFFASLVLLMCLTPKAWAYDGSVTLTGGQTLYYNYVSSSQSITITYPGSSYSNPWDGFTKPTGRIVIPANISHNGTSYPVTQIGAFAFYDCTGLSSLTIPSSVTYIGGNAFYGVVLDTLYNNCQMALEGGGKMRHLIIGNSVTTIANGAYCGPSSGGGDTILESVVLGSSVTTIEAHAFRYCKRLDSIAIPSTVTSIGMYAFSDCSSLRSVAIPSNSSLGTIGQRAFSGCTSLKILTLPIYMTSIGSYAFYGVRCVIYPGSNFISGSPWGAGCVGKVHENGFVYSTWAKTSLVAYIGDESTVVIPATVNTIEEQAFSGDTNITSVVIPIQVLYIGKDAFKNCTGLASVTYNAQNCQITGLNDPTIFQNCPNVTSFTFGDSIQQLPGRLFVGLTGLPSVVLPEGITYIPYNAFYECTGLTSVTLPSSLTSIQTYAFYGCTSLTSLTIPASVTSIAGYAFANCTGLTNLVINAEVTLSNLYGGIFSGDTNIANLTFGCSVIPESFCSGMYHLQTITIDSTVTTIGANAMAGHSETHYNGTIEQWLAINMVNDYSNPLYFSHKLYLGDTLVTKLHIPEGVTAISNNFRNDTALTHIYIPSTVTSISDYAFNGCAPYWFYFKPSVPPSLASSQAFIYNLNGNTYGSLMMVPWQSLNAYKTATNYTTFAQNLLYPDSCMLSVNVNNPAFGAVTLDGGSMLTHLYQLLDTATISVTLLDAANYSYNVAADGCTVIDTINTNTYKVRLNRNNAYPTFTVNFIGNTHHVNAVANCAGCGTVTGTNDYSYGDTVTVEATPASGYYFVRWADGSTDNPATFVCTGDTTVVAIFSPIVTPELCMVSVQDDRNVLLWDVEDLPIASYSVYREGNVSGEYEAIATIPYAQAGEWVDTTSRPMSRSYRYRLTATDTCGNESQPSGIHKTMHLTISQGVGSTWNLVWTAYEGAEYSTYVIYRGTSAADIQQIDIMPSAGNTTYSDNAAPAGEVYYQVGVMMTTPCNDAAKAATVSRSNIASSSNPGEPEGIDDVNMGNIHIWSADGRIVVEGAEGKTVQVFDMMGRRINTEHVTLNTGVYMVKVGNAPARKVVVMQ